MAHSGLLQRHRFRWTNGVGFALTLFYALWLLVFLLAQLQTRFGEMDLPMPLPFAVVAAITLPTAIGLLAWVLVGYAWQGADLGAPRPRHILFAWTCAAGLFFLSQTLALVRFGSKGFPNVPGWMSGLYWYFAVVGALTFGLLLWVNAEGHHYPWEGQDDDEAWEDDAWEEEDRR